MDLYDAPADVVRKSIAGLGLTPEAVASQAGIETRELMGFINGNFVGEIAQRLAPVLGLDSEALCHLPSYQPAPPNLNGIRQYTVPFEDEEVNIWIIESEGTALAIDCGFRPDDFQELLEAYRDQSCHLLITHAHRDHIGGLTTESKALLASIHAPNGFADSPPISAGDTFEIGPFKIRAINLSGHHPETLGYHVKGLGIEAFAVGDSVFAGSMGGCPNPSAFNLARRTIQAGFSGLDPEIALLPGHGPATSLSNERRSNAFLASWLA